MLEEGCQPTTTASLCWRTATGLSAEDVRHALSVARGRAGRARRTAALQFLQETHAPKVRHQEQGSPGLTTLQVSVMDAVMAAEDKVIAAAATAATTMCESGAEPAGLAEAAAQEDVQVEGGAGADHPVGGQQQQQQLDVRPPLREAGAHSARSSGSRKAPAVDANLAALVTAGGCSAEHAALLSFLRPAHLEKVGGWQAWQRLQGKPVP